MIVGVIRENNDIDVIGFINTKAPLLVVGVRK
jgi:hypothetical protein